MGEDLTLDNLICGHRPGVEHDHTTGRALSATARHHPTDATRAKALTGISNRQNGFHSRHRRRVRHSDPMVSPTEPVWGRTRVGGAGDAAQPQRLVDAPTRSADHPGSLEDRTGAPTTVSSSKGR